MKSAPLLFAALFVAFSAQLAFAESLVPLPDNGSKAVVAAPAKPSILARVETWTKDQWAAAENEWVKDESKWAACRKQSEINKLSGRDSWSFLYDCMKS